LQPKITDFGLAKKLDGATGLTHSGAVLGTPSYMAPEQASGDGKHVGPSADVWALGAILYELLTGQPPFLAATAFETLRQVLTEAPSPMGETVPAELEAICLRCLEKKPAQRYGSAAELADDLERFLHGLPLASRPRASGPKPVRFLSRSLLIPGMIVLGVLSALALVLGGDRAFQVSSVRPKKISERAVTAWALGEGGARLALANWRVALWDVDSAQQVSTWDCPVPIQRRGAGPVTALALSDQGLLAIGTDTGLVEVVEPTAGRRILTQVPQPSGWTAAKPPSPLWAGRRILTIQAYKGPVRRLVFRDRGRTLVSATARPAAPSGEVEEVKTWDLAARRPPSAVADRGFLGPDGKILVVSGPRGTLRLLDASTGKERVASLPASVHPPLLTFSGDGTRLAYAREEADVSVREVASGRELLRLPADGPRPRRLLLSSDGAYLAKADTGGVSVWETQQGRQLFRTTAVDFAPVGLAADGSTLFLEGSVTKGRLNRLTTQLQVLSLPDGQVRAVMDDHGFLALTADDRVLLTNGGPDFLGFVDVVRMETLEGGPRTSRGINSVQVIGLIGLIGVWFFFWSRVWLYFKPGKVSPLVFSPDGQLAASALGRTVRIWEVGAERLLVTVRSPRSEVQALSFSADAQTLSVVTARGSILVFDVQTGVEQQRYRLPCWFVKLAGFSPDGQLIAHVVGWELRLYAVGGEQPGVRAGALPLADCSLRGPVRFSANGQIVATCSEKGLKVWHLGPKETPEDQPRSRLHCVAFALFPDGCTVALSGSHGGAITVWDMPVERRICLLTSPGPAQDSLVVSPDGRTLAGIRRYRLRLWDLADGRMFELPSQSLLRAVAFSPDGRTLAVADAGGGVSWYDVAVVRRNRPTGPPGYRPPFLERLIAALLVRRSSASAEPGPYGPGSGEERT
jgi:WD40 repeat protein